MNRKIRRKKLEIIGKEAQEKILRRAPVGHLAFWDGREPYVIPLNFGWEWPGEAPVIFIHCAREGRKIALLEGGGTVCFEAVELFSLKRGKDSCSWNMGYRSFIGWGLPQRVEAPEEKSRGLNLITAKYDGGGDNEFPPKGLDNTAVYRILLEEFSAKGNS